MIERRVAPGQQGRLVVPGGEVYYRIVGGGDAVPILAVHGGPGAGEVSVLGFEALASDEQRVVFWDQLGCGRSERPDDPSLWTMQRSVAEVEAVRQGLGLGQVHLLGHSWGAMLSAQYAVEHSAKLSSLMLLGGFASSADFAVEGARLRGELPQEVRQTLDQCEAAGDYESVRYQSAIAAFYCAHYLWVPPPPPLRSAVWGVMGFADWLMEQAPGFLSPEVLQRWLPGTPGRLAAALQTESTSRNFLPMWGRNNFKVEGNLRDWDVSGELHRVTVPTLVMCGRHDVATPRLAERLAEGIPGARTHIFERSAHFAMEEEPEEFRRVVGAFLSDVSAVPT